MVASNRIVCKLISMNIFTARARARIFLKHISDDCTRRKQQSLFFFFLLFLLSFLLMLLPRLLSNLIGNMRVRRRDRRMHQNHFKQYFKLNSIFICPRAPHANERCDNVEDFNVIYSRAILYQLTNLLSHI